MPIQEKTVRATFTVGQMKLICTLVLLAGNIAIAPIHARAGDASADKLNLVDPTHTDSDKYKVRFENGRIRVLEYRDLPGDKTHMHEHPAFVLYAVGPFKRRLLLPDGKVLVRVFSAGDIMWSDAQAHLGENVGETPTHVIMVEMKQERMP
jgi:beta-alanine degradation protein BauB